jgi:hypothetical protein
MDLLIKRLGKRAHEKEAMYGTIKAMDLHMTCKVCGEGGHLGNNCPETREDNTYINNGFRPQGDLWWNQSHPQYQKGNYAYSNSSNQPSLRSCVRASTNK